jgi:hypothetical protein
MPSSNMPQTLCHRLRRPVRGKSERFFPCQNGTHCENLSHTETEPSSANQGDVRSGKQPCCLILSHAYVTRLQHGLSPMLLALALSV